MSAYGRLTIAHFLAEQEEKEKAEQAMQAEVEDTCEKILLDLYKTHSWLRPRKRRRSLGERLSRFLDWMAIA